MKFTLYDTLPALDRKVVEKLTFDINSFVGKGYLAKEDLGDFIGLCVSNLSKCPFCGKPVLIAHSSKVYRTSKTDYGYVYICSDFPKCNSYVGTHHGTVIPLGSIANYQLRRLRMSVHATIDELIKQGSKKNELYRKLSSSLGLKRYETHVGLFDPATCTKALALLNPMVIRYDDFVSMAELDIGEIME